MAGSKGHVVAVEPDTWLVNLLRRSSLLPNLKRAPVMVIPAAASDEIALGRLNIAARARSSNFMEGGSTTQAGGSRTTECVVTITLDWLLAHAPSPQVLKVDVEGFEHRVLAGASRVLAQFRPRIWCEVSPQNREAVSAILHAAGYGIYNAKLDPSERQALPKTVWDTLALPLTHEAPAEFVGSITAD